MLGVRGNWGEYDGIIAECDFLNHGIVVDNGNDDISGLNILRHFGKNEIAVVDSGIFHRRTDRSDNINIFTAGDQARGHGDIFVELPVGNHARTATPCGGEYWHLQDFLASWIIFDNLYTAAGKPTSSN